mgnify:CR=1 FL=1
MAFGAFTSPPVATTVGKLLEISTRVRVPPESAGEPVVVTFALSGLGEARIDNVSIRVLEQSGGAGTPATLVSSQGQSPQAGPTTTFPGPNDLVQPRAVPLPNMRPEPSATGWPNLFGGNPNEPPPGEGGGTVDPFKRARSQAPTP